MITLHHVPQSRSMRVLWLLHEMDEPFEVKTYPFDKTLRSAEYLRLSPAGRVPALELDGARLFESLAIVQILCERFSPAGLGRGLEHPERMDWLVWLNFAETLSQHTAALTQQHVALRDDSMRSPIVMKLEAARVGKCYDALEAQLSAVSGAYLLESGFSAADVAVGQAVYMSQFFVKLDGHAALGAWYARMTERPAFQRALPQGDGIFAETYFPPWPVD